jgi:hypothetical protein
MVVDPLAAAGAAPQPQPTHALPASQPAAATARTDLFDYVMSHGPGAVELDGLSQPAQADRLANPATLGDKILSGLDGFSHRTKAVTETIAAMEKTGTEPAKSAAATVSGPAAAPLSSADSFRQSIVTVGDIFNFAIETQLVERAANQATSSVNTLVKGQ